MKNKVLVVAVHPDDETLGCAGTLLKHKANGDEIYWLIVTSIKSEYRGLNLGFSDAIVKKRDDEIEKVAMMYQFNDVYSLGLPTMRIDEIGMSELISEISSVFKKIQPNILYLPFKNDVHSDHRKVFEASYSCTKSFRYSYIRKVYMMETLSETEFSPSLVSDSFIPNSFNDISDFFEKKLEIMQMYESEIGIHPFPRSLENIKALATYRGAICGVKYAESFMLLKEIT
jgi:LmbE family N-acetylglucosaminyl deacetylase